MPHRDLKPSNIIVVECRDRLLPKLLDSGSADGAWGSNSAAAVPGAALLAADLGLSSNSAADALLAAELVDLVP